jgi:PPOX class probable F420-dependent enzyme
MTADEARQRFVTARVGRLATADRLGRPHLVPFVFAVSGEMLVSAVDHKPKRSVALRRLANVEDNPRASVLVDEYLEDWDRLWWARADGSARVVAASSGEGSRAVDLLVDRYPQYRSRRPDGPVLLIEVDRWSGWSATDARSITS